MENCPVGLSHNNFQRFLLSNKGCAPLHKTGHLDFISKYTRHLLWVGHSLSILDRQVEDMDRHKSSGIRHVLGRYLGKLQLLY